MNVYPLLLLCLTLASSSAAPLLFKPFCATPSTEGFSRIKVSRPVAAAELPPADAKPEPTVIDLMILYTPQALAGAGREATLQRQIQEAVQEANFRYTNSQVNIRFNLVYHGLIAYAESGKMTRDWALLAGYAGDRGALAGAATLRDHYKADLVIMIIETDNSGYNGVADIAGATGNVDHAYAVVRRNSLALSVVLPHEIGHLLGGQHDREHATDLTGVPYPGAFPYSYCYRFESLGTLYVTGMAYQPGMILPYFSNPNLTFQGSPLGIPAGAPGEADNAKTFNRVAPYAALYRTAQSRIEFAEASPQFLDSASTASIKLVRTGQVAQAANVTLTWETDSSARVGTDYNRPASALVSFAANQTETTVNFPLLRNTQVTGDRVIHITLASPSSAHGLGWKSSMRAVIRDQETVIAFESAPTVVRESAGELAVPIIYRGGFGDSGQASVQIQLGPASDSAKPEVDFIFEQQTLAFTPDRLRQTLRIPILDNSRAEPDRIFHLLAGGATNEVRILDDDRDGASEDILGGRLLNGDPAIAIVQPDGKLLVAGSFTELLPSPPFPLLASEHRTGLMRFSVDGTLDPTFRPEIQEAFAVERGLQASVSCLALQPDGKILISGAFAVIDGESHRYLARLNSDGSVDRSFGVDLRIGGSVNAIFVRPGGQILIGGIFEQINGQPRAGFACLESDGSLSSLYSAQPRLTGPGLVAITSIVEDSADRILLGGFFEKVNGLPQTNLVRLQADGRIDSTFDVRGGASAYVTRIRLLPNDQVLVSGYFDSVSRVSIRRLARLNANGSVDQSFRPNPNAEVNDFLPLSDGRVLIAGAFTQIGSVRTKYVAMLNPNGTLDTSFDTGAGFNDYGLSLAARGDGSIFVIGSFTEANLQPANRLARLRYDSLKPRLAASLRPDDRLTLTVLKAAPGAFAVQSSVDLQNWKTVARIILGRTNDTLPSVETDLVHQFYRLRFGP